MVHSPEMCHLEVPHLGMPQLEMPCLVASQQDWPSWSVLVQQQTCTAYHASTALYMHKTCILSRSYPAMLFTTVLQMYSCDAHSCIAASLHASTSLSRNGIRSALHPQPTWTQSSFVLNMSVLTWPVGNMHQPTLHRAVMWTLTYCM